MLKQAHLSTNPHLQNLTKTINNILGFDIIDICENGPIEVLNRTVYCQPAVVVSSILAFEKLKEDIALRCEDDTTVLDVCGVAGYSVGEVSALYMSGRMVLEDTITLVKERALAMDYASSIVPSGMCTLQGLHFNDIQQLCEDLTNEANDPQHHVSVAIQQFPNAVSLGGSHRLLNCVVNGEHLLLREGG